MLKECPAMLQDQTALQSFVTELVHVSSTCLFALQQVLTSLQLNFLVLVI